MTRPRHIQRFGASAVPWTVSWSAEEDTMHLAMCPVFKRMAIRQEDRRGQGKPQFGKPHMDRQRAAIGLCLCDLCGKSLRASTKVSLSHAKAYPHGADGWAVLAVEPMLHRRCALESMRWCPSLKRDAEAGTLMIRHVHRWRPQCAIMTEEYTQLQTGQWWRALGHAKVELLDWTDRDLAWLDLANG